MRWVGCGLVIDGGNGEINNNGHKKMVHDVSYIQMKKMDSRGQVSKREAAKGLCVQLSVPKSLPLRNRLMSSAVLADAISAQKRFARGEEQLRGSKGPMAFCGCAKTWWSALIF